jgi:autotransporter-associated beta strand protein
VGGPGILSLSGANTYTGPTVVNAGRLTVTGSIAASQGVSVNAGGTFEAAITQSVKSLAIASGGEGRVSSFFNARLTLLTVGDNVNPSPLAVDGKLEIVQNGLAVDVPAGAAEVAALATVRKGILSGYNASSPGAGDGKWDGSTGITSIGAREMPRSHGVGYALASEVLGNGGGRFVDGDVDGSAVLVRWTLLGDADLNGVVNFNDLVRLAQNYNTTVSGSGDGWWVRGDFTYDGVVDFNDLVKLARNSPGALPFPSAAAPGFEADVAAAFGSVPEPGALTAFTVCALVLCRSRRAA